MPRKKFNIRQPSRGSGAPARIARVDCFKLATRAVKESWAKDDYVWPSVPPQMLIKVTAEDGTYGIGEAQSQHWYLNETYNQMVECVSIYQKVLQGTDSTNIASCHQRMLAAYGNGLPGARATRAGVDMALHDLLGKRLGLPVHALLGGAYRTEFDVLTNLYHKTPDEMAKACTAFVKQGYKGLKVKVGDVLLAKGWTRANLLSEVAKLEAALAVTPRDVLIDADANQGWVSAAWTISVLDRLRGHDNLSIEQPLRYDDIAGAAQIRAKAAVPIILDESVWSAEAVMRLVQAGACDRIVLKINRVGGLAEARAIIDICESAAVGVSVDTAPWTILGDTAVCHVAATCRYPYPVDCEGHVSFLRKEDSAMFTGGVRIGKDGVARLPDAPGLGVDVDWSRLRLEQLP